MGYGIISDLKEELEELTNLLDEPADAEVYADDLLRKEYIEGIFEELESFGDYYQDVEDVGLIPEFEFEEYAQEFAYDIGMVDRASSIDSYVDWDRWADDLKMDYTTIEIDGTTYYGR